MGRLAAPTSNGLSSSLFQTFFTAISSSALPKEAAELDDGSASDMALRILAHRLTTPTFKPHLPLESGEEKEDRREERRENV